MQATASPAERGGCERLRVTDRGPVAWLRLNRPERLNALDAAMLAELCEALTGLRERQDVEAVVLHGAGNAFSSGVDLDEIAAVAADPPELALFELGRRAAEALAGLPQVTLAAVHGSCVGGALVLAAACDLRLATATATFSLPELDLGLPLAWGGVGRVARELGPATARQLLLGRRTLRGADLERAGFLRTVADDAALLEEAAALAERACAGAAPTTRLVKLQLGAAPCGDAAEPSPEEEIEALRDAVSDPATRRALRGYLRSRDRKSRVGGNE